MGPVLYELEDDSRKGIQLWTIYSGYFIFLATVVVVICIMLFQFQIKIYTSWINFRFHLCDNSSKPHNVNFVYMYESQNKTFIFILNTRNNYWCFKQ